VTLIESFDPVKAYAKLDYGNDMYLLEILASNTPGEMGNALTVFAAGGYGGNWYKW
jgi:hypothetical protein